MKLVPKKYFEIDGFVGRFKMTSISSEAELDVITDAFMELIGKPIKFPNRTIITIQAEAIENYPRVKKPRPIKYIGR